MKRLIILCCLLCICSTAGAETTKTHPSVLVQTTPLVQRDLTSHITGFGVLTPEPDKTLNLNLPIAGRVDQVLVNAGQHVNKGDVLLTVSVDPNSALNYKQAKNNLAYARAELARQKKLFRQQLATRSQLDNAKRNLKDAEAAMTIQKHLGAGITLNKLKAPITGIVTTVTAVPGDRFAADTNLMQVAKIDTLRTRLGVEPEDSRELQPGLTVHLSSVLNTNQKVDGKVVWISNQINPKTQLVDVSVRIAAHGFAPGTQVRGNIIVKHEHQFAVPRQSVLRDNQGSYIFQIEDNVAHRINVTTGLEDNGWVAVKGKFITNAPVVTLGNYELDDGGAVRVASP